MLTLHNIPWCEFKHFVLSIQRHHDLDTLLGECPDYIIDDNTHEIWAYNNTLVAPNPIPCIVWNNDDLNDLKWWRNMFDELAKMYQIYGDNYRFNLIQYINDEIESLITEHNGMYEINETKTCIICGLCDKSVINHVDYDVDICCKCHLNITENMKLINIKWDDFKSLAMKIDIEMGDNEINDMGNKIQYVNNIDGVDYNYIWAMDWWNDGMFVEKHVFSWATDIINNIDGFGFLTLNDVALLKLIKNTK